MNPFEFPDDLCYSGEQSLGENLYLLVTGLFLSVKPGLACPACLTGQSVSPRLETVC